MHILVMGTASLELLIFGRVVRVRDSGSGEVPVSNPAVLRTAAPRDRGSAKVGRLRRSPAWVARNWNSPGSPKSTDTTRLDLARATGFTCYCNVTVLYDHVASGHIYTAICYIWRCRPMAIAGAEWCLGRAVTHRNLVRSF